MLSPQHEAGLAPIGVVGPRGVEVGQWGYRGQARVAAGGRSVDELVCSGLRMSSLRGSPLEGAPRERLLPFAQTFPEWRALCVSEDPCDDSRPLERQPGCGRGCGRWEGFLARVLVAWIQR